MVGDQWLLTLHRRTPNVMGGAAVPGRPDDEFQEDVKCQLSSHVRELFRRRRVAVLEGGGVVGGARRGDARRFADRRAHSDPIGGGVAGDVHPVRFGQWQAAQAKAVIADAIAIASRRAAGEAVRDWSAVR